jgi:hypothetical protein
MNPRLVFPFHEEKTIKSMLPNEEGIKSSTTFNYSIFPKLKLEMFLSPRAIPDYNKDSL